MRLASATGGEGEAGSRLQVTTARPVRAVPGYLRRRASEVTVTGESSITGHPSSTRHERRRRALAGRKMYLAAGPFLPNVTSVAHQNGRDIRLNRTSLVSARSTWIGDSGQ